MRSIFTLVLTLIIGFIHAQDLTGVWQGHFRANNLNTRNSILDDRYKIEVQVAQRDKGLEAVTYSYLSSLFYGKAAATGAVNPKTNKVLLQEVKLLEVRNQYGDVCIMTCFLQYSQSGSEEFLEGTYSSMNIRDSSNCGRGTIFLRKVPQSDFYKEPFLVLREKEIEHKKDSSAPESTNVVKIRPNDTPTKHMIEAPKTLIAKNKPTTKPQSPTRPATKPPARIKEPEAAPIAKMSTPQTAKSARMLDTTATAVGKHFSVITPKVLQSRSTVLTRSITVNTREVILNIYDDGAIDHDTVSVYLDKRLVVDHAMLTDRPIVVTLHLDESDDYHELVMVAENEGEIPPNTSLMIVKAGDKEYEVRITSTEQKNAMVTFRYQK